MYNKIAKGSVYMQVSSINQMVPSRQDFRNALIGMDDDSIRQIAYLRTTQRINQRKNNKVNNALFYSAPLAAGLGMALLSKNGATKLFGNELSGIAGRMAKGIKTAAYWTAGLAAIDLFGKARNKVAEKSPELKKFDQQHPLLSIGTMLAIGFGILTLVNRGAGKLTTLKTPEFLKKGTEKLAKNINNSKFIIAAKDKLIKLAGKTPSALKEIGETALNWAPTALLFGGLFHSISSVNAVSKEFNKNYTNLKEAQLELAQSEVAKLSVENDFLKQDPQNAEDIALLNNPTEGLEDIIDEA